MFHFIGRINLSSNVYLDELCPVSSRNPRRLCVILVAMEGSDDRYIDSYRQFIMERKTRLNADKITLSYIYANRQTEWLKPFLERRTGNAENHARDILVLWRYEHVKARFVWLKGAWKESGSDTALDSVFSELLRNSLKLDEMAAVGNLKDEYSPSWWTKMSRAIIRMLETLWFHATKEETLPVLSVFGTLLCIFLAYYALNYMTRVEPKEKRRFSPANSNEWHPDDPNTTDKQALHTDGKKDPSQKTKKALSVMEPLMHELRAESYFGMVRLLKPGCRSVILLVDEENRQPLLEQFARNIYPLRNNKTFSFGYLMVEKNLPWFRKLLEHTLPLGEEEKAETNMASSSGKTASMYERLKAINPRQTIGTVLVLCGWKLYFSIYHPMHTTPNKKHFLGFEDDGEEASDYMTSENDDDDDTSTSVRRSFKGVSVQNVLNGFGNWLDRLLEGSIRRYYIPEWPDNLKSDVDMSEKPKSVKKTLNAGRGQVPQYVDGTKAIFNFEVLRPSDVSNGMPESRDAYESIEDTRKGYPHGYGRPMELIFGKKFQLAIFETLLRSMLVDEISQFDVETSELHAYPLVSKKLRDLAHSREHKDDDCKHHSNHMCAASMVDGTGYAVLDELMKKPTPLRFIFHLLQVQNPQEYEAEGWQLSAEDKLKSVDTLKQQGNQLVMEKNYLPAIEKYREALTRLDTLILREKPGDPEWEALDQKNIALYLNLSQCYLSTGNYYEAIGTSDEALSRDGTNEKALYRRARAYIETWDFDKARNDLNALVKAHPTSTNLVEASLAEIQKKEAEGNSTTKNIYRSMFKGDSGPLVERIRFAVTCSSNMNRSMEAHFFLEKRGINIRSFGTGNQVKLPGREANTPNCYEFGTSYEHIYQDLIQKDKDYYTENGLLNMIDRNRRIKEAPQKLQETKEEFDVIIALEERVYDQVLDMFLSREQTKIIPVHIINVDIEDNHEEATVGAWLVRELCERLEKSEDLDNDIDDVLAEFEGKNPKRNILHTVQFY
ncbi:unnamed protein product, partial [Mesorhabditis belari]|uniref:protein-serine/threonine phosphatase n=1 Tax=Mesorhabditis belari TaxID=2138241 RepID=A0AAF3J5J2_9BILA